VLTRPQIPLSLAIFLAAIVGISAAVGHVLLGVAIAVFVLALVAIDAKPSWKRIWNPPDRGPRAYEGLRFFSWKRR
jgi:ABC-type nickel/cobalt efflux system permease component RcnA